LLLVNKPGKLSCFQYHINVRSALVGVKQRHQPVEPVAADSGRTRTSRKRQEAIRVVDDTSSSSDGRS
jgi:hypothetical protein